MPKANEAAIGIRKRACKLVSSIIGNKPIKVVIDVSRIALNLAVPAVTTESNNDNLFFEVLIKSSKMMLSFTTTPDRAMMPRNDRKFSGISIII